MAIPSADYYGNEDLWGNHQYITLETVINNFIMSTDPDDFTSTTHRTKILYQARRGIRELYYDVLREIKAIEQELGTTLTIVLPPDFVNYVRISRVYEDPNTGDKTLIPLAENNRMSIAQEYLQDSNFNLLFDANGCVLKGSDGEASLDSSSVLEDLEEYYASCTSYNFCSTYTPNRDYSRHFPKGSYKIDKNRGVLQFSSDVAGKDIVLEYISDGLYTGCEGRNEADLRIHKFAESALLDYIYYELIKNRRSVPANEKARARKEFYNSRRIAKRRLSTLRVPELMQLFKGQSRWIKQ